MLEVYSFFIPLETATVRRVQTYNLLQPNNPSNLQMWAFILSK